MEIDSIEGDVNSSQERFDYEVEDNDDHASNYSDNSIRNSKYNNIIKKFEEENLQPRSWELQGEVSAKDRKNYEILDTLIDADFVAKPTPLITEETTQFLESIIIKRIKDKVFDDVERKVRNHESLIPQRKIKTSLEDNIRKGLSEIYEDEYKKAQNDEETIEYTLDPNVAEIEKEMKILFKKLDALSHYQFTPSIIKDEIKVVKNIASLKAEEVGPTSYVLPNSIMVKPEDIKKRVKKVPKAKEELTITDRKRLRRKKKVKQRILAKKGILKKLDENEKIDTVRQRVKKTKKNLKN